MIYITNTNLKNPDNKVHMANMEPAWVLSAPCAPHVGPTNLAIREGDQISKVNILLFAGTVCLWDNGGWQRERCWNSPWWNKRMAGLGDWGGVRSRWLWGWWANMHHGLSGDHCPWQDLQCDVVLGDERWVSGIIQNMLSTFWIHFEFAQNLADDIKQYFY